MPRLPIPGSDGGQWGNILNEYLNVSHNTDGTIKPSALPQIIGATGPVGPIGPQGAQGFTGATGPQGPAGADGVGAVDSVNSQTGAVMLSSTDVGAAPSSHNHSSSDITSGTFSYIRLGSGGDGSGSHVLKDDGTWGNLSNEPVFSAFFPDYPYQSQPFVGSFYDNVSMRNVGTATWGAIQLGPGTYDAMGIWITATGSSVVRLCLDTVDSNGLPGSLVIDAGTVDCSTVTGLRVLTFGTPVVVSKATWFWCRAVVVAYDVTTLYALTKLQEGFQWPLWAGIPAHVAWTNRVVTGVTTSGHPTGANEEPSTPISVSTSPRFWIRRAS